MTVLARFRRDTRVTRNGFPAANMFDQPQLEEVLRTNLTRYRHAQFRGDTEVVDVLTTGSPLRLHVRNRATGEDSVISADFVLGCDGANSIVRKAIGAGCVHQGGVRVGPDQRYRRVVAE